MTYACNHQPLLRSPLKPVSHSGPPEPSPVYARLPLAPRNASPVPHLTSLYHFHRAGEYGDRTARQLRRQPYQRPAALFQARLSSTR